MACGGIISRASAAMDGSTGNGGGSSAGFGYGPGNPQGPTRPKHVPVSDYVNLKMTLDKINKENKVALGVVGGIFLLAVIAIIVLSTGIYKRCL